MTHVESGDRAATEGGAGGHRWLGSMGVGVLVVVALLVAACTPSSGPSTAGTSSPGGSAATPSVTVMDQGLLNGTVTIAEVVSDGPGGSPSTLRRKGVGWVQSWATPRS